MTAISPALITPVGKNRLANAATATSRTQGDDLECPYVAMYTGAILAVSALFLFGVAIPTAMVYGNAAGWGLGAFCAFWGGPGFGVMAASAMVSMWHEEHGEEL